MYDTKTIAELEDMATNLRIQLALHPERELERVELKECERWIALRKGELAAKSQHRMAS